MIVFNSANKRELTIAECLEPAMEITSKSAAKKYLADYTAYIHSDMDTQGNDFPNPTKLTAKEIALHNLNYYAGYYGIEIQKRVQNLFGGQHPIFGKI